ncbi:acyl-CoA dehydrogenase family protein [Nocardioides sp. QY071]|uniref:acyl-CoA dehydrogenase family protein n=1 Tax=Nocardioides sp. QY071 TaxID=3044187 RepID=UPI00249BDD2C|nr:acyl-CoA dehydrogenase family protein [Nocardioides sp. QY071]WGY02869.1 acyl-CoA dehydrogenase family protein [Nocardioides sp. QY071]
MSDLDLLPTEIEEDLRGSVRDLLGDRCDPAAVIAMYDGDRSLVAPLWKALAADLGLAGLLVAEEHGGHGATAREAAVVLEELGRHAAPVPFLTSAVIATSVLESDSVTPAGRELLAALASGERTAALVVPWSTGPGSPVVGRAGTVTSVAGALDADVLLVPVTTTSGLEIRAVAAERATVTPVVSLDMTRQLADVTVPVGEGEVVVADAEGAVRDALELGAALLASEQVGAARWCLDTTLAYVKVRRQFGRVVGGFQAIKHRLADLYTGVESATAAARYAAVAHAVADPDAPVSTAVAQAFCSDLAVLAAEEAVQLHGGIGMTWEHPAHVYLKRAKADQVALGTPGRHRARLATLVDLPGVGG